jgi:predicted Ser/Thr protein kinase
MASMNAAHRTLAGRYELAEVIGRGGMGTVYRAVDLVLGRAVAVKVLPGQLADQDPSHVARFEREARAAAALSHPAVVAVYDTGSDEATRFIVMEFVAGKSLAALLREEGPLDPGRAVSIAEQVAAALAAAHAAGIVHRDIKPANVMVREDGSVKVLDFGLARALDASALTQSASVLGTAAYMSPEQALGKPADERSDIYSLGCLLYALLVGGPPFAGEAAAAILNQHAHLAPSPVRSFNGRVSPALDALVTQMLAKAPDERPANAEQVRERLHSVSAAEPSAPTAVAAPAPAHAARTARLRALAPTAPTARLRESAPIRALVRGARPARRHLAPAGVLAALVVVIALIALAAGGGSGHATHTSRAGANAPGARTTRARSKARTTSSAAQATTTSTTTSSAGQPPTVSGAAGALSALITQDAQSGTIDGPAAQQLTKALTDVLDSAASAQATDAQRKLADLTQTLTTLASQGHVGSAAAPALAGAVSSLSTALAASAPAPQTPEGGPSAQEDEPPGHGGGEPPGKAKKHGD